MSKQRKPTEQTPETRGDKATGPITGPESATPEHAGLGNAAIQARLSGDELESGTPGFDVVRDTALPLVGRAAIALEVEPKGAVLDRLLEIVAQSELSDDRKDAISERLRGDESLAGSIRDVVEKWLGSDGADVRGALGRDLGRIEQALIDGKLDAAGWRTGDAVIALSAATTDGSTNARAEALVADLARATAQAAAPDAIVGLCRDLHLALMWLEEEEEELGPDAVPEL